MTADLTTKGATAADFHKGSTSIKGIAMDMWI